MVFSSRDLSVIGYANGFTLWHLRTIDPAPRVGSESYFNGAAHMFRAGDFILVNAGGRSCPAHGMLVVIGIEKGAVEVRQLTAVPGRVNNNTSADRFSE